MPYLHGMGLHYCADVSPASWLVQSRTPWEKLVTLGPDGFEARARLRFIPDPARPGQSENDVDLAPDHPVEIAQARRALHLLGQFTATPQDCYYCLWEGYGGMELPPTVQESPLVDLPHRRYALLRGAVADIDEWGASFGDRDHARPPAFVWPADRSWCFASDVDPHWAGIAGSRAAVDALVANLLLDVVPVGEGESVPTYY